MLFSVLNVYPVLNGYQIGQSVILAVNNPFVYIDLCVCVCVCFFIYIYIFLGFVFIIMVFLNYEIGICILVILTARFVDIHAVGPWWMEWVLLQNIVLICLIVCEKIFIH